MLNKNFPLHPLDEQLEAGLRGDFSTGKKIADHYKEHDVQNIRASFNRGWYEMWEGNLLEGLRCLDNGRWCKAFGDQPLPTDKPIYRDQNLKDKHLLMCLEGGLGDEIINARFASDFAKRGAKVTISCDPSLMSVFARIEGVSAVVSLRAAPEVYHDYWVPGMSAPHILQYEYKDLTGRPYLSLDENYQKKWKDIFHHLDSEHKKPRIGVRFYGNPKFAQEAYRKFPRELMEKAIGNRNWFSLQKEETNLPLQSWEDTLAAIAQLDLVVTSCTSVAHASAALGKKTWIVLPVLPYYVWAMPGSTSKWYESVRLFRQGIGPQGWEQVFEELSSALKLEGY